MAEFNKSLVMGNLTRDIELKFTPTGTNYIDISLALNRKVKNQSGDIKEFVSFVDVRIWGKRAENCKEYLKKGDCIFVEGELRQDRWQNDAGEKRQKIYINAHSVEFIRWGKDRAPGGSDWDNKPVGGEAPEGRFDYAKSGGGL